MKTPYDEWLEEARKNKPDFLVTDKVLLNGDDSGPYTIIANFYEPQLGREVYTLVQGDKVRYSISDNMQDA